MCNNNKYYDLQDDNRTDEQLNQDAEIMEALETSKSRNFDATIEEIIDGSAVPSILKHQAS